MIVRKNQRGKRLFKGVEYLVGATTEIGPDDTYVINGLSHTVTAYSKLPSP